MIVAGIDIGGKNVHVVILKDDNIIAKGFAPTGISKAQAAESTYNNVLSNAGLTREDIERVVATGSAARRAAFASSVVPDAAADARGAIELIPSTRTLIDVGAEEGRAIKVNAEGKVLDFAVNEKCAAGTGTFVDAMARALEVEVEEMAQMSLKSTTSIPMNAQCAVFGESEVVSLIHAKTPKQDIARAVHDAIAGRIGSVVRIIGIEKDVVIIGGVANNVGLIDSLKRDLGVEVIVPDEPEYVSALGAALLAAQIKSDIKPSAKVAEKEPVQEIKERRLSS
jgi:benzoyl-CoA reductase subunit D